MKGPPRPIPKPKPRPQSFIEPPPPPEPPSIRYIREGSRALDLVGSVSFMCIPVMLSVAIGFVIGVNV